MDNAFLNLGPGKDRFDGFGDPLEVIDGKDQNVIHPAVLELVEDGELVLGRFGLADSQPQALLLAIKIYAYDRAKSHISDMAFQPHFQEHGIHVDRGID
jgi:hypothetical protein